MDLLQNINISLAYNWIYFFLAILFLIAYTVYSYKTTLPKISNFKKIGLISLRSFALLFIIILIFDPVLRLTHSKEILPKILVFIDNSESIKKFADVQDIETIKTLFPSISESTKNNTEYYTFGSGKLNALNYKNDTLNFNETATDLSFIQEKIVQTKNLSSVLIISDGIINQGPNPLSDLGNLQIPIFTLGIGDTTTYKDISIQRIITNSTIYADRETDVEVILQNKNFNGNQSNLLVFDNDSLIYNESISIGNNGIERIIVPYNPRTSGNHLIRVRVDTNKDEKNLVNNTKETLIRVLSTKKTITLIAGSPSADYSAIKQSIELNEEFRINEIIELGNGIFVKDKDDIASIKDSDIIFLVGFPAQTTPELLLNNVINEISSHSTPVFICFSHSIDLNRISYFENILNFDYELLSKKYIETEIVAQNTFNNLLGNDSEILLAWNKLPPIDIKNMQIVLPTSSEVLISSKVNKEPVVVTNGSVPNKSILITAANIWKWKIKASDKEKRLFDNFIINSLKWLSLQSSEYFSVAMDKKNYNSGELVKFTANLYNTIFEPLSNERIILTLENKSVKEEYQFSPIGNGLYDIEINIGKAGIYNYTAQVSDLSTDYKSITGSFNIEPLEIELLERKLNRNFLESISLTTGGKYYTAKESESLINDLSFNYQNKIYLANIDKELRLSRFEIILLIIVLLLSIEWILRKVYKMI